MDLHETSVVSPEIQLRSCEIIDDGLRVSQFPQVDRLDVASTRGALLDPDVRYRFNLVQVE